MDKNNIRKALFAGLAATASMTILMFLAPMMGLPDMKIGNMLADFMMTPVLLGWAMHLMIGLVWALVFVIFIEDKIQINSLLKGMLFLLFPWLLMQTIVAPVMGLGVFFSNAPRSMMMVLGTLMGHLLYGLVLGLVLIPAENK